MKVVWLLLLAFGSFLYGDEGGSPALSEIQTSAPADQVPAPWLTGPLIAPVGTAVPYGDFEVESYFYCTTNTGGYNSHWRSVASDHNVFILNPQFLCFLGMTPWMDINMVPQLFYKRTHGQSGVTFGDLQVAFDFQLLDPGVTPYFPGIKFFIRETFPTGPFQRLNPSKLLTDQSGAGSFATTFGLVFYEVYHLAGVHFLSATYSAAYTVASPAHVHGFNAYGGGFGTDGRALPGNSFQGIVSFELTLSQNWVFAIDHVYTHTDATQFCGTVGTTVAGLPAVVGAPSSEQISFAPAIEYNFNEIFGIEVGCWFTAWGRNATEFRSGVVNFAYTY